MNSVILQLAYKYVKWIMLSFAVIVLLRGHNYPGGGFIGGLLAALSIVFKVYAYNIEKVHADMRFKPQINIVIGLVLIVISTLPSLAGGLNFLKGVWWKINIFNLTELKIGTPLIFDIGVFFAVIGVVILFILSLNTEK